MKKILCIVLSILTMLSAFGICAFAECAHTYEVTVVAPKCADRGYNLHVCTKCGDTYKTDYTNALGHVYGAWEDIKSATCVEEGLQQRVCVRCKGTETKTIPVKDHIDANSDGHCDECGAEVAVEKIFSPYDWLMAFFKALREWFAEIFA